MNTVILQKCVDELKKESFVKEYVLGMLETIIEMNNTPTYAPKIHQQVLATGTNHSENSGYTNLSGGENPVVDEIPAFLRTA